MLELEWPRWKISILVTSPLSPFSQTALKSKPQVQVHIISGYYIIISSNISRYASSAAFHGNNDAELQSYNLRMLEFSQGRVHNHNNMNTNNMNTNNINYNNDNMHQYTESDKTPPQVYPRGGLIDPILGDIVSR